MAIQTGDVAPAITLPVRAKEMVEVPIGREKVVLLFFPLAFSPVCTEEMCQIRDSWSEWEALDAKVLGISVDSPFVTDRFRTEEKIPFDILSDFNKDVSATYGVLHEELIGLKGVAKRSAFVIDADGKVTYAWVTDDPRVQVPFDEVKAALK